MARFQSLQGVHFYNTQDIIGGLKVPDDVLFFCENRHPGAIKTEPSACILIIMSLRVSSATFSVVAFNTSGANRKLEVGYLYQVTLSQKPFEAPASRARVHFANTWCNDESWCKVKNNA